MPAVSRDTYRAGACVRGVLHKLVDGSWEFRYKEKGGRVIKLWYPTYKRARAKRREWCERRGFVLNAWRWWPGDPTNATVQMKVGEGSVLVDDEDFEAVAQYLWTFSRDKYVVSSMKYRNSRKGSNHAARRTWSNPKVINLKKFLYPAVSKWKRVGFPERLEGGVLDFRRATANRVLES